MRAKAKYYFQLKSKRNDKSLPDRHSQVWVHAGLDIGYVPAGPDAFFRWSGQFGPQQLIFGPVFFFFFFFFTIHI